MTYVIIAPSGSVAFACNDSWHKTSWGPNISYTYEYGSSEKVCPTRVAITCGGAFGYTYALSVNFAGRGKVGGDCGGADEYVAFSGGGVSQEATVYVDVWKAHKDGVWSSSVEIKLYITLSPYVVDTGILSAGPVGFPGGISGFTSTFLDPPGACPPTLLKTFNVFDDKTYSLT